MEGHYDIAALKTRLSLRDLFEKAGTTQFRKNPKGWMVPCPFHEEKTPSCLVNEEQGTYFCFGCRQFGDSLSFWATKRGLSFADTVKELAVMAGMASGVIDPSPSVVKSMVPVVRDVNWFPPAMSPERAHDWGRGVERLQQNEAWRASIAHWRGYRPEFVAWLCSEGLVGLMPYYGQQRVGFLVKAPLPELGLTPVGVHLRLEPNSTGNPDARQSWRYVPSASESLPNGVGAWPFVIGNPATATIWFVCEGQWDAGALADLMEWDKEWPKTVALIGLRGSTSWKLLMRAYPLRGTVTVFAIADKDAAGAAWWQAEGFLAQLEGKVRRVFSFLPTAQNCKDFNDLTKTGQITKIQLQAFFLKKLNLGKRAPISAAKVVSRISEAKTTKRSFWQWAKFHARDLGEVGLLCAFITQLKSRPPAKATLKMWVAHWVQRGVDEAAMLTRLAGVWQLWREGK